MRRTGGLRRRWMVNTLRVVVPLTVVCVAAVTAAFAAYCYAAMQSDLRCRAESAAEFFAGVAHTASEDYYRVCTQYAESYDDRNRGWVQFIDAGGALVASSQGHWAGEAPQTGEIQQAMEYRTARAYVGADPTTGERIIAVAAPLIDSDGQVIGVVRFLGGTRTMDGQIAWVGIAAAVFCGVFLLIVVLSTNYYIQSVLSPLADITEKAQRIANGSYGTQIHTPYDDEIRDLAETINALSIQVNQNEKLQREFVSSLSHELRTPLTAITGWGETLLSSEEMNPEETRRGMTIILREARRLTEMVVELLDFTKLQDGRLTLNMEFTDLRAEFEDTIFMYGSRLKQEGIHIHYEDYDGEMPAMSCDPQRLRQVFLNILDNAAKHGGGTTIDAAMFPREGEAVITIRDYGSGIPEDELQLVKKKFYKGSSKARGSGIGLAVCDEIVALHGGTLELENAPGGGMRATIRLPMNP